MQDSELIARIYDCASKPEQWADTLQDIAERANAFGGMIFDSCHTIHGERVGLYTCSSVYDPNVARHYAGKHNDFEVVDQAKFARLSSDGDEVNLIRCDALAQTREGLETQSNVQAMMEMGIHYRAGALLSKETTSMDRFALQFTKASGPIGQDKLLWVETILPHVAKALSIGRVLHSQKQEIEAKTAVLGRLPFGVAIVSKGKELLSANPEFMRIAEQFNLLSRGATGLSVEKLPNEMREMLTGLEAHGKRGTRPRKEAVFLPSKDAGFGVFLEISPTTQHTETDKLGGETYVVTALDSGQSHTINADAIAKYFPLSKSEKSVLELVVRGRTNVEIAEERGRTVETVNSQLKALLRKSGSRNRTELVRVAVSLSSSALYPDLVL
ncbi:MAG: DNA-binding CsgD family transcriptional regulator [Ascidiaceihabitans sp.]|jgi:DNA-binding CsgD family transcriptional regulator